MRISWTLLARDDISAIITYLAKENVSAALKVWEEVEDAVNGLADLPLTGRPGRIAGTRELIVTGTPYVVPYRVIDETVQVLRVYHTSRKWPPA